MSLFDESGRSLEVFKKNSPLSSINENLLFEGKGKRKQLPRSLFQQHDPMKPMFLLVFLLLILTRKLPQKRKDILMAVGMEMKCEEMGVLYQKYEF